MKILFSETKALKQIFEESYWKKLDKCCNINDNDILYFVKKLYEIQTVFLLN